MSKTILVIDDAESLRMLVRSYLVQEGFRVVTAANGREGLFVARQERPDLIILDLMMPELGGFRLHQGVCSRGRRADHYPDGPDRGKRQGFGAGTGGR